MKYDRVCEMAEKVKFQDRRYIGSKETMAYVLFDASKGFSINSYSGRFFLDLVKIDFAWNAVVGFIAGVWDIINDVFAGVLVDKTETRWGKFKPYLLLFAIPGTLFSIMNWGTPFLFDADPKSVSKLVYWTGLNLTVGLMNTFRGFAETGFISSMSPNPLDKVKLFTMAELISSLWESFPGILMGVLIDLINHNIIGISMRTAYLSMGALCAIQGGAFALYFATVARERIAQSVDKPSFLDGIKTILNNRPMLIMMLSDLMGVFTFDTGVDNYFVDVLGSASIKNVIILPGAPMSLLSYSYVPWAQKKFSTKALWIFGDISKDLTNIMVYLIGIIGGRGTHGFYNNLWIMIPAYMARDIVYKSTLGIQKIVPKMMMVEALDYCEWKNGYRTEGTTIAAKGVVKKITGTLMGPVRNLIMIKIGYSLKAGFGQQTERTKFLLFMGCTLLPGLTGLLTNIPKFFYNSTVEIRERMYEELAIVRAAKRKAFEESNADTGVEKTHRQ